LKSNQGGNKMSRKRDFEPPPGPGEEEEEEASFERGSRELYGDASVKPSLYHCAHCDKDILSQDVVWDKSDQPHCPKCNSLLERRPD
jgi:DNA-directed RNA polymerase subunit RPC12/RpoP